MLANATIVNLITVYGGLPIFICGTTGNLLNICGLWSTCNNPCGFIFLVFSFNNIFGLFYGLFLRILAIVFNQYWSTQNLVWCKTRIAFSQTFTLISLSCICFASIDRLFASSHQLKFRRFSRLSTAKWIMFLIILFWFLHSIPYLVFSSIIKVSGNGVLSCSILPNEIFAAYRKYIVFPVYFGLFPTGILVTTGLMTYKNTTKLRINRQRQAIQKQLTLMMLVQIPIIVLSTLPYAIFMEYRLLTRNMMKSMNRRNIESVTERILFILFYFAFACQFFVFYVSSSVFRKAVKTSTLCQNDTMTNNNRIQPAIIAVSQRTKQLNGNIAKTLAK